VSYLPDGGLPHTPNTFYPHPDSEPDGEPLRAAPLIIAWLLMVAPCTAFFWRLGDRVEMMVGGAGIMTLVGAIGVAAFAGLAVVEAARSFHQHAAPLEPEEQAETRRNRFLRLLLAALVLPVMLTALGTVTMYMFPTGGGADMVLFIVAGAIALANLYCWFFAHFLAQELAVTEGMAAADTSYSAFQVAKRASFQDKYAPPMYPALSGMALLALFFFAAAARPVLDKSAIGIVLFCFGLLALLALSRYHGLLTSAAKDHVMIDGREALQRVVLIGLGILLIGMLAAVLPLKQLVDLGQWFRHRPPPPDDGLGPQNNPSNSAGTQPPAPAGIPLWLLLLLIIVASVTVWLIRRWMRKHGIGRKIAAWLRAKWQALAARVMALLRWLFPWWFRKHGAAAENADAGDAAAGELLDVFDHPELLANMTPAQIIVATFNLLLDYSHLRGWLRRTGQPPFEVLGVLSERSPLERNDLTRLTWAYSRAAYAGSPTPDWEVANVKQVWERLKPQLVPEVVAEETGEDQKLESHLQE
jgi:hypothetical protein